MAMAHDYEAKAAATSSQPLAPQMANRLWGGSGSTEGQRSEIYILKPNTKYAKSWSATSLMYHHRPEMRSPAHGQCIPLIFWEPTGGSGVDDRFALHHR